MKSPAPGAPPGASAAAAAAAAWDLASFDAPFFTRSTARGVLAAEGGLGEMRKGRQEERLKRVKKTGRGDGEEKGAGTQAAMERMEKSRRNAGGAGERERESKPRLVVPKGKRRLG